MKHPQGAPAPEEEPVKVRLHGVPATVNHDGITEALASRDFISGPNGDYSSFEKLRKPEGGFDAVVLCNNREAAKRMVKAFECFRWPRANCLTHASLVEVDGSAEDDDISERTVFVSGLRSVFNNDRLKALMEKSFGPVVGCVVGRPQGEGPDGLLSGFCTFASQNTVALALCTSRAAGLGVEMALVKMKAFGDDPRIERYHSSMGIQLMSYYMASLASEKGEADKPKQKPRGLLPTPKKPSAGSRKADSSSGKKGRNRPSVGEGKQPSVISLEMALSNGVVNGIPFLLPAGAEEPPFLCLQKALNLPPLEAYNATQVGQLPSVGGLAARSSVRFSSHMPSLGGSTADSSARTSHLPSPKMEPSHHNNDAAHLKHNRRNHPRRTVEEIEASVPDCTQQ